MFKMRSAVVASLVPFILVGCAAPQNRTLSPTVAAAIQPLDVQIGIRQPELYAEFEPSNIAAGAAVCGAIPGIGILLAAACGGVMGAMDATVNAQRAKEADELVRPLKDVVVDVKLDDMFTNTISTSLRDGTKWKFSALKLTKTVNDKAYEETFRASTSSAVMFVNVDYRLSTDFSTVEVSALGSVFPRSPAARTAAGKSAELPEQGKGAPLMLAEAAYRADIIYRGTLPAPAQSAGANIEAWKASDGRLLRAALDDGARQVARLLAEDMKREPGVQVPVLGKADLGKGLTGDLLWKDDRAQLVRSPIGALIYKTTVVPGSQAASTSAVASQ